MSFHIGCNQINFPFTMAPMVGLSHIALRRLVQEYTPQNATTWWPTEMLNSRRLPHQELGETPETYKEKDQLLIPQILGNEEHHIRDSVRKLEEWGAVGIDINMGCPVSQALKHNYGVALMGDPKYASQIVKMTKGASSLPVSVKIRAAKENNHQVLLDFVSKMREQGLDWVCLHPRTADQKRKGSADWKQIKLLKETLDIPVVGNGDIQIAQDAIDMIDQTNCDSAMIGRALTARPWLFWQLGEALGFSGPNDKTGSPPSSLEEEAYEYGRSMFRFVEILEEYYCDREFKKRFLFYLKVSSPWLNFGHSLTKRLQKFESNEQLKELILESFEKPGLSFTQKTNLRY